MAPAPEAPKIELTNEELAGLPPKPATPQMSMVNPPAEPQQSVAPSPVFSATPTGTTQPVTPQIDITKQPGYRAPVVSGTSTAPSVTTPAPLMVKGITEQKEEKTPISGKQVVAALGAQQKVAEAQARQDKATAEQVKPLLNELHEKQKGSVQAMEKANEDYQRAVKKEQDDIDEAAKKYTQSAVQNKGFWAVSDTPQKISTGLNLLAAALYTLGRQPERADMAIKTAYGQMTDAVNKDLKVQQDQRDMLKEALNIQSDKYKNRSQLLKDDYADSLARLKAGREAVLQNIDTVRAMGENAKMDVTGLDKVRADAQMKLAEANTKIAELNRTNKTTSTERVPVVIKPTDLISQMRDPAVGAGGTQKMLNDAEASAKSYREIKPIQNYEQMTRTNQIIENAIKSGDYQGLSIELGKVIATDLDQGSFNTQLANMLLNKGIISKLEDFSNFITGKSGVISESTAKTILAFTQNQLGVLRSDPKFMQQVAASQAAEDTVALMRAAAAEAYPTAFGKLTPPRQDQTSQTQDGFRPNPNGIKVKP
jgi:hypothetical protein